jgi:hypothetical protein
MNAKGYDVSGWQTSTPALSGVDFLLARAGYGSGNPADKMYATHAANALKAGKVLGAYWFWYSGQNNAAAVAQFLSLAGSAHFLVLDLEGTNANTTAGRASAQDFIAKLKTADPKHRKVGLYHSASGYPKGLGQDFNWVALWSATSPDASAYALPCVIWQYNGAGTDNLDNDYWHGDATAMRQYLGLAPVLYTQAQVDAIVNPLKTQLAASQAQVVSLQSQLSAASASLAAANASLSASNAKIAAAKTALS